MKKIWILLIVSVLLLSMVSCSEDQSNTTNENSELPLLSEDTKVIPERKAEISGVVKSVVGNEFVIALIEKSGNGSLSEGLSEDGVELTEEEKAAKQAENRANKGGNSSGGMTEVTLSNETIDVVIPVGITILQSNGTGEMSTLNIGDIFKGTTVKIWTLEGGEGTVQIAEFVQVLDQ